MEVLMCVYGWLKQRAHLNVDCENMFLGLNEMLESKVPLEVCLSTVKLLMSEDR